MARQIPPVEAALREYQDQSRVIVNRPKFDRIPTLHEEVECIFASLYEQSRRLASQFDYEEEVPGLEHASLHDVLDDGAESITASREVFASFWDISRIEADDPHMLTDQSRSSVEYDFN